MSLVEKAKKKAQEADAEKKREAENDLASKKYLQDSLAKISKEVLAGLKEFHNVKTNQGTLKLIRKRTTRPTKTIANLRLTNRPNKADDLDLLFVDAAIESGTRDYDDDCRNVPYTEAIVSIYVKNPPTDDRFSYAPTCNGAVKALGLTTYFGEFIHNWNDDEIPEKLEKVAEWLAPLFSKI